MRPGPGGSTSNIYGAEGRAKRCCRSTFRRRSNEFPVPGKLETRCRRIRSMQFMRRSGIRAKGRRAMICRAFGRRWAESGVVPDAAAGGDVLRAEALRMLLRKIWPSCPFTGITCEITIIQSNRHSKGFCQICSSGFSQYSGRLGTAGPFLKFIPHGFSQYSGRLGTAEPFLKFVPLVFCNIPGS